MCAMDCSFYHISGYASWVTVIHGYDISGANIAYTCRNSKSKRGFVIDTEIYAGFPFSFGVFQEYYSTHLPFSKEPSGIAIIGTSAMVSFVIHQAFATLDTKCRLRQSGNHVSECPFHVRFPPALPKASTKVLRGWPCGHRCGPNHLVLLHTRLAPHLEPGCALRSWRLHALHACDHLPR